MANVSKDRGLQPLEADEPLRDLGILFVHGIGQSGRGETLLRFGEPLRACIEKVAVPANDAIPVKATVVSASLDPSPETPANTDVLIRGASRRDNSKLPEQRWLIAEAWWAKKFPTPTFGEIASWSFEVLPWTLIAHFDRRFRRLGFRFYNAINNSRPLPGVLVAIVLWLAEGLKLSLALAVSPLLLVLIGLISLLGLIPYAKLRDFARAVQQKLAATVGESYVFMHQQITGAAICASVAADLEWLGSRCKRVAVVAHSQGGAIAHKVLRGPVTAPCDLLVTFGSGLAKLSEMERAVFDEGRRLLWMPILGAFLAAAAFLASLELAWHYHPGIWVSLDVLIQSLLIIELGMRLVLVHLVFVGEEDTASEPGRPPSPVAAVAYVAVVAVLRALMHDDALPTWLGLALAAGLAAGLAFTYLSLRRWHIASRRSLSARSQWQIDRNLYRNEFQLHNRQGMRWHDLYASADPVPNGVHQAIVRTGKSERCLVPIPDFPRGQDQSRRNQPAMCAFPGGPRRIAPQPSAAPTRFGAATRTARNRPALRQCKISSSTGGAWANQRTATPSAHSARIDCAAVRQLPRQRRRAPAYGEMARDFNRAASSRTLATFLTNSSWLSQ